MQYPDMKNRLAYWREKRGFTQEQLAEMTGLSRQQINRIENHKTGFSDDNKEKAAEILDCFPTDLIDDGRLTEEEISEVLKNITTHVLSTKQGKPTDYIASTISKYFLAVTSSVGFDVKLLPSFLKVVDNGE